MDSKKKKKTFFYISSSALKLYLLLQVIFLFGVFGCEMMFMTPYLFTKIDGGEKVL